MGQADMTEVYERSMPLGIFSWRPAGKLWGEKNDTMLMFSQLSPVPVSF